MIRSVTSFFCVRFSQFLQPLYFRSSLHTYAIRSEACTLLAFCSSNRAPEQRKSTMDLPPFLLGCFTSPVVHWLPQPIQQPEDAKDNCGAPPTAIPLRMPPTGCTGSQTTKQACIGIPFKRSKIKKDLKIDSKESSVSGGVRPTESE